MATQQQQRLLKQLQLHASREDELLRQSRVLAQHAAEKQAAVDKLEAAKAAKEKLEALKVKANKIAEEVQSEYLAHAQEDERLRKELSDSLGQQIQELNSRVQADGAQRGEALEENERLKAQIKILKENLGSGDDKFGELIKTRERETEQIQARLAKEVETEALLKQKIAEQQPALEAATAEHNKVKEDVDEYVAKFQAIQQELQEANAEFTKSKQSQDRMVRRIHQVENEALEAKKRADRAKKELEVEQEVAAKLERQLQTLELQTKKLQELTQVLKGDKPAAKPAAETHVDPTAATA